MRTMTSTSSPAYTSPSNQAATPRNRTLPAPPSPPSTVSPSPSPSGPSPSPVPPPRAFGGTFRGRQKLLLRVFAAASFPPPNPLASAADPLAGNFNTPPLRLELSRAGNDHTGSLQRHGQSRPVQASPRNVPAPGSPAAPMASPTPLPSPNPPPRPSAANGRAPADPSGSTPTEPPSSATTPIGRTPRRGRSPSAEPAIPGASLTTSAATSGPGSFPTARSRPSAFAPGRSQIPPHGAALVAGVLYRYSRDDRQLTLAGLNGTFATTVQVTGNTTPWLINGKTPN